MSTTCRPYGVSWWTVTQSRSVGGRVEPTADWPVGEVELLPQVLHRMQSQLGRNVFEWAEDVGERLRTVERHVRLLGLDLRRHPVACEEQTRLE